jgi:acid phosphatase (class A)
MKRRAMTVCLIALLGSPTLFADSPAAPIYLLASQADMLHLLPPPPEASSQAQRADLQAVLEAQRAAHANGSLEHAIGDAELNCSRIAQVLDNATALTHEPQVFAFLNEAARESAALSGATKIYWKRTRPFAFDSAVERHADIADSDQNSTPTQAARRIDMGAGATAGAASGTVDLAHSSYPSGHSTFGTVCAILLADMVPERRAALFERALDYAHSRMVVGAHFPSDLEAGRLTGTVAAELLMQNPRFERDFATARATLRAELKLPPEPVESAPSRP